MESLGNNTAQQFSGLCQSVSSIVLVNFDCLMLLLLALCNGVITAWKGKVNAVATNTMVHSIIFKIPHSRFHNRSVRLQHRKCVIESVIVIAITRSRFVRFLNTPKKRPT